MAEPGFTPVQSTPGFTPAGSSAGATPLQATPPGYGPGGATAGQSVNDAVMGAGNAVSDWLHKDSIIPASWTENHPVLGEVMKSFDIANVADATAQGAKGLVKGGAAMVKDLASNPNWVFGKDSTYDKFVGQPAADEANKATDAWKQGHYSEAAGHELAGALPMVGPWAAHLGERAGTGDVGGAIGEAEGTVGAGEVIPKVAKLPGETYRYARDIANRARSLDDVSNSASAVHNVVQKNLQTTVASLRAEGARATEQAIQADTAKDRATGMVGSIPTTPALTKSLDALDKVGYRVSPAARQAIARIGRAPRDLTLKEAMDLRTTLGDAWAKASDAESRMVLDNAQRELSDSIGDRFRTLIGNTKPWDYRNAKFTASYNIQQNFKDILDSPANPYESIGKMDSFSKLNLDELKREMQNQGLMDQYGQLEAARENAGKLAKDHKVMSKEAGQSLFKMSTSSPGAALAGITAYIALHPVAGLASYMLGTIASNALRRLSASAEIGRIGREYGDPISSVRNSGPVQNFQYPTPPSGVAPKGGSPTPTPSPAATGAAAAGEVPKMTAAEAQEAARKIAMGSKYTPSSAARADVEQKAKKVERAKRMRKANKGPLKEGDSAE